MTEEETKRFDKEIELRFKSYCRSIKYWWLLYILFMALAIFFGILVILIGNDIVFTSKYASYAWNQRITIGLIIVLLLSAICVAMNTSKGCFKRYKMCITSTRDMEQLHISILDNNADLKNVLHELKRIANMHYGKNMPAAPAHLKAHTINSTQVRLSWDASAGSGEVEGYRIYRDGIQVASSSGTSYIDNGLGPVKTYTYAVERVHQGGLLSARSSTVSVTTPPSAAKVFTGLSESFNSNTLEPKQWRPYARPTSAYANPNTAVTAQRHRLEIMTTQGIKGGCAGITTALRYNATDSAVFVKLDAPGDQSKPSLEVYFDLYDRNNAVRFVLSSNILSARKQVNGNWSDLARIRYDAAHMSWWRFQEKAGTLSWQYADNAQDWKELHKARDPFSFAMVRVRLGARTLQPVEGGAGIAAFDNLNVMPVSASFSASCEAIVSGQSTTLMWSSAHATSCRASGGWHESKPLSGAEEVSPTVFTTYTLTWQGAGGTVEKSVSVRPLSGLRTDTLES